MEGWSPQSPGPQETAPSHGRSVRGPKEAILEMKN